MIFGTKIFRSFTIFRFSLIIVTGLYAFSLSSSLQGKQIDPIQPSSYYSQGLSFLYNGDYDKAVYSFEKSIESDENTAQSHYRLANLYKFVLKNEPKFRHHIDEYLKLLEKDPTLATTDFLDNDNINYTKSLDYFKQGVQQAVENNLLSARENMLKAIENYPFDPIIFYNLANVCHSLKNIDEAIRYYKKSISLNDNNEQAYFGLGVAYQQKGNSIAAIDAYRSVLKLNPKNVPALNNIAVTLEQADMIDDAIDIYRQIIAIKPKYARAYNNLGSLTAKQKKYQEAEKLFRNAHTIDPDYLEPHYNLGHLYEIIGDKNKALQEYRLVFLRDSNYPGIIDKIETLEQKPETDPKKTEAEPTQTVQRNCPKIPADPVLSKMDSAVKQDNATLKQYIDILKYCIDKKDLAHALVYSETAMKKFPENLDLMMLTAKVYTMKKYYFKAIEQYQSILKIEPDMKEAHRALSLIYVDKQNPLKNPKRAMYHYKRSAQKGDL